MTRPKVKPNKRAFTLLEIILVIAILAMMATVVGAQMGKCVNSYAFQNEIEMLYNTLKQSQVLAVTYKTDVTFHFFKEKGAYYFRQETSEPFEAALFNRETKKLTEITEIKLNDKIVKQLDLTLYSHGSFEPRVKVHLCSPKQSTWLDLQGGFLLTLASNEPPIFNLTPMFPEDKLKKFLPQKQQQQKIPQ